jgi:hypothetical protein
MISNGNSFALDQMQDPKVRVGFLYRILGGVKMSFPPDR